MSFLFVIKYVINPTMGAKKILCAKSLPHFDKPKKNNPLSTMSGNNTPATAAKAGR